MRRGKEKIMCESECERDREREIVVVCERIVRGSEVFWSNVTDIDVMFQRLEIKCRPAH